MTKDNGGQAFPSKQLGDTDGIPFEYSNEGMTFAGLFCRAGVNGYIG